MSNVRALAAEMRGRYERVDVLANNAGALFASRKETSEGFEQTFALNHLAPFLLTNLLRDRLAGGRVVTTASDAHESGRLDLDDLQSEKSYSARVYGTSKLCNILFTRELARRAPELHANCFHPGVVRTGFAKNENGIWKVIATLGAPFLRSPERGARSLVWLALSDDAAALTGEYVDDEKVVAPSAQARDASSRGPVGAERPARRPARRRARLTPRRRDPLCHLSGIRPRPSRVPFARQAGRPATKGAGVKSPVALVANLGSLASRATSPAFTFARASAAYCVGVAVFVRERQRDRWRCGCCFGACSIRRTLASTGRIDCIESAVERSQAACALSAQSRCGCRAARLLALLRTQGSTAGLRAYVRQVSGDSAVSAKHPSASAENVARRAQSRRLTGVTRRARRRGRDGVASGAVPARANP